MHIRKSGRHRAVAIVKKITKNIDYEGSIC